MNSETEEKKQNYTHEEYLEDKKRAQLIREILTDYIGLDPLKYSNTRKRRLVDNRHLFVKLVGEFTELRSQMIGDLFAIGPYKRKNHATILHSFKCADQLIFSDKNFLDKYSRVRKKILELLPTYDITQKDVREVLVTARRTNFLLVQREINRKGAFNSFVRGLQYIPKRYKNHIKEYLEACQIPL